MNWEVLTPDPRPEDFDSSGRLARPRCLHIREAGSTESLCHAVSVVDDLWRPIEETHPEDVGSLDRCAVCWSVYERRNAAERGYDARPGNYLPRRRVKA